MGGDKSVKVGDEIKHELIQRHSEIRKQTERDPFELKKFFSHTFSKFNYELMSQELI